MKIGRFDLWFVVIVCLHLVGCTHQIRGAGSGLITRNTTQHNTPQRNTTCYKKIACETVRKMLIFKKKCKVFKANARSKVKLLKSKAATDKKAAKATAGVRRRTCLRAVLARPTQKSVVGTVLVSGVVGMVLGAAGALALALAL